MSERKGYEHMRGTAEDRARSLLTERFSGSRDLEDEYSGVVRRLLGALT